MDLQGLFGQTNFSDLNIMVYQVLRITHCNSYYFQKAVYF